MYRNVVFVFAKRKLISEERLKGQDVVVKALESVNWDVARDFTEAQFADWFAVRVWPPGTMHALCLPGTMPCASPHPADCRLRIRLQCMHGGRHGAWGQARGIQGWVRLWGVGRR